MDAVTHVPAPANETVLDYAPGSPERAALEVALAELGATRPSCRTRSAASGSMGTGERDRGAPAARPPQGPRHDAQRHARRTPVPRSTRPRPPPRPGASCPSTTAPRSCSRPPSCSPARGAPGSTPRRCSARARRPTRPRSTPPASSSTSGGSTCTSPGRSSQEQPPLNAKGIWNRTDYRSARGLRLRDHAVQLHRHRRQPADRAGAHGQHRRVEAVARAAARGAADDGAARGGRHAARRHQHGHRATASTSSEVALRRPGPRRHPLHRLDARCSSTCGARSARTSTRYRTYPRLVGETGGKDFILAHPSADPDVLRTAMIRGAFEFQGQKCSAASRAYVPASVWKADQGRPRRASPTACPWATSPTCRNFMGAVIDDRAFAKHKAAIDRAHADEPPRRRRRRHLRRLRRLLRAPDRPREQRPDRRVVPHRVLRPDPAGARLPRRAVRRRCSTRWSRFAPYALTGSIIAQDRAAIADATERLRFAAGNFYVNDKPTGAVVGQQPFGGGRASGTNDKAGAAAEPACAGPRVRSIKETFVPPKTHTYPHMG